MNGALLAYCFLNLLADAVFPLTGASVRRSLLAMVSASAGLLILLGLWSIDWYGPAASPRISFEPGPALISLIGAPIGVGLLFLWRRFNGSGFEWVAAVAVLGAVLIGGQLLPWGDGISGLAVTLLALTVAVTLGFGLRGVGLAGWRDLTGRVLWGWAWILRAFLIAISVSVATF